MKKITNLLAVMSILVATVFITGCGLKSAIDSTHNTWYKYTKNGGSVNVDFGDDTSDSATSTTTLSGAELYLYFDDDKGLKVIIQKDRVETVDVAGGLLQQDISVTTGAEKQYTKEQFGTVKWASLVSSGMITKTSAPKFATDRAHCIDLSEAVGQGIQWKKFLKKILINQLLGED